MGTRSVTQTVPHLISAKNDEPIFSTLPQSRFVERLAQEIAEAAREFARKPFSYLRAALLPFGIKDLLPLRFAYSVWMFVSRPFPFIAAFFRRERIPIGFIYPPTARSIAFVSNAFSTDDAGPRRHDNFTRMLLVSGLVHAGLIGILVYLTLANLFAPYTNYTFVKKPPRPFNSGLVAQLYAPYRKLESSSTDKVLSLEELQKREQKRREEIERRKREEAERKKAEKEKAEKEKAEKEALAKAAETDKQDNAAAESSKYGEINETALKELIGKMYAMYKSGGVELNDFSVMASFKIARDGSLPRSSIAILKSSGDPKKDDYALQILWLIGESHALGPLSPLTSTSIRFDLKNDVARLTITGFGPTPEWVDTTAFGLRVLFFGMSKTQKNSNAAELLSLVKINTMNNRIDLNLTVSRERASEMMRAQYANN